MSKPAIYFNLLMVIGGLFLFSLEADAATIYFQPQEGIWKVGQTVRMQILLDTEGESVNALELSLRYPPLIEMKEADKVGSAIKLWVRESGFSHEDIVISGGTPGGINSSNALITTLVFTAKAVGEGTVVPMMEPLVLLNDGLGTKARVAYRPALMQIIPQGKNESPDQSPADTSSKDRAQPERFTIYVSKDPSVFEGQYFASFHTTDSGSGIDHYELREGSGPWNIAQAPYVLSDQELKTVIRVRAYDSNGNYRESAYPGLFKRIWLWIVRFFSRR